jgi:hypothetical protein
VWPKKRENNVNFLGLKKADKNMKHQDKNSCYYVHMECQNFRRHPFWQVTQGCRTALQQESQLKIHQLL